jgi:ectoine hydroxylase-related dioxygenase (phytanoyl-CoA dioxygenase family)
VKKEIAAIAPSWFHARKGDVLFWHANLVHGGSPRRNLQLSRKAIVCHYFAEGCVCYHDLSASPSSVHGPAENFPVCGASGQAAAV